MKRSAIVAFLVVAAAIAVGASMSRSDDQEVRRATVHEGSKTFVWQLKGGEVTGLTIYKYNHNKNTIEKRVATKVTVVASDN